MMIFSVRLVALSRKLGFVSCGGFRLQHFHHLIGCGVGGIFFEKAGNDKDGVAHADLCHAVRAAFRGGVLLVLCHRQLLSSHQFFQPVQLGLRRFTAEVLACKEDRGAHFQKAVINPGMSGVQRILQAVQCQIGGDD